MMENIELTNAQERTLKKILSLDKEWFEYRDIMGRLTTLEELVGLGILEFWCGKCTLGAYHEPDRYRLAVSRQDCLRYLEK